MALFMYVEDGGERTGSAREVSRLTKFLKELKQKCLHIYYYS